MAAMEKGMEYMAISDHSKTASYAQGLNENQIKACLAFAADKEHKFKIAS